MDVWVSVPPSPAAGSVDQLKIERLGSAYLVLTRENGHVFDTFFETTEHVEAYLQKLNLEWPRT